MNWFKKSPELDFSGFQQAREVLIKEVGLRLQDVNRMSEATLIKRIDELIEAETKALIDDAEASPHSDISAVSYKSLHRHEQFYRNLWSHLSALKAEYVRQGKRVTLVDIQIKDATENYEKAASRCRDASRRMD